MVEVYKNIFVGNETDCSWHPQSDWAIIHACKIPCHRRAVGYTGNLKSHHPNYLVWEMGNHLVLNMVDMEEELKPIYTHPIMKTAMQFIEKPVGDIKMLIHCNQGISRSPSIALLYLARQGGINNQSYLQAANEFRGLYSFYNPGTGIASYMNRYWQELLRL